MIAVQLRAAIIWQGAADVGHVAARLPHVTCGSLAARREAMQIPVSDISSQFAHFIHVVTLLILDYHIVIQLVMPPY